MGGINEGGIHRSKVEEFCLDKILIEKYIPEFNEADINEARHRNCHILKLDPSESIRKKFYLEINSLDLKLFEGCDFSFASSSPLQASQSLHTSQSFSGRSQPAGSFVGKTKKKQPLFNVEEGYLDVGDGELKKSIAL